MKIVLSFYPALTKKVCVSMKEKMFLVKKFLCCFKIEVAAYVCVIDDVIISILSSLLAVDMMKKSPHITLHPDLSEPVKFLIFIYAGTELIASLLVFIAMIKVWNFFSVRGEEMSHAFIFFKDINLKFCFILLKKFIYFYSELQCSNYD